jgi:RNA polymerase sigma factor (sigma-70 family)
MADSLRATLHAAKVHLAPRETPDGELLRQFSKHRDEVAFAVLVQRYGALVHGTCRRVLGRSAEVDDALQATFVVLARRASEFVDRPSIAAFLHGVAFRTAITFRKRERVRREREHVAMNDHAATTASGIDLDLLAILDEELAALPEKYREPVVLCELEGVARRVVAERLGIAEGTISSRLNKAHQLLQRRLIARGVTSVSVVTLLTINTNTISAECVAGILHAVVSGPSTSVSQLALEVSKMYFLLRFKANMILVLLVAFVVCTGSQLHKLMATTSPDEPPKPVAAPKPPVKVENPVWTRFKGIVGVDRSSLQLFEEMMGDQQTREKIELAEANDAKTFEAYCADLRRLEAERKKAFAGPPMIVSDESNARMRQISRTVVSRADVLRVLFWGTKAVPANETDVPVYAIIRQTHFQDLARGDDKVAFRKLFLAWLKARTLNANIHEGLFNALITGMPELLPMCRAILKDPQQSPGTIMYACSVVAMYGDTSDLKLLAAYRNDTRACTQGSVLLGKKEPEPETVLELRDVAAGASLYLRKQNVESFGFEIIEWRSWWVEHPVRYHWLGGYNKEFKRAEALANAWKWIDEPAKP